MQLRTTEYYVDAIYDAQLGKPLDFSADDYYATTVRHCQ